MVTKELTAENPEREPKEVRVSLNVIRTINWNKRAKRKKRNERK